MLIVGSTLKLLGQPTPLEAQELNTDITKSKANTFAMFLNLLFFIL